MNSPPTPLTPVKDWRNKILVCSVLIIIFGFLQMGAFFFFVGDWSGLITGLTQIIAGSVGAFATSRHNSYYARLYVFCLTLTCVIDVLAELIEGLVMLFNSCSGMGTNCIYNKYLWGIAMGVSILVIICCCSACIRCGKRYTEELTLEESGITRDMQMSDMTGTVVHNEMLANQIPMGQPMMAMPGGVPYPMGMPGTHVMVPMPMQGYPSHSNFSAVPMNANYAPMASPFMPGMPLPYPYHVGYTPQQQAMPNQPNFGLLPQQNVQVPQQPFVQNPNAPFVPLDSAPLAPNDNSNNVVQQQNVQQQNEFTF